MRSLVKSPTSFVRHALEVGKAGLEDYSCPKSPRKYTQPQLFAILALKEFMQLDYRGVVIILGEWKEVRDVLGLEQLPNFSTLKYAQDRFQKKGASQRCLRVLSDSLASTA